MKRGGWRLALTPILLVGITAAILWWIDSSQLQPNESAVLSTDNLRARASEHVQMSAVSTALATLVAVPLGIVMSRRPLRRAGTPILFVANIGQTVPTVAVLALHTVLQSEDESTQRVESTAACRQRLAKRLKG